MVDEGSDRIFEIEVKSVVQDSDEDATEAGDTTEESNDDVEPSPDLIEELTEKWLPAKKADERYFMHTISGFLHRGMIGAEGRLACGRPLSSSYISVDHSIAGYNSLCRKCHRAVHRLPDVDTDEESDAGEDYEKSR